MVRVLVEDNPQTTSTILYPQSSQYVDLGAVSYMETKLGDDGMNCFESLAPVGHSIMNPHSGPQNPNSGPNGKLLTKQESFYSTPVNVTQNFGQTLRHQSHSIGGQTGQQEPLYGQHQALGTYYTHTMMMGLGAGGGIPDPGHTGTLCNNTLNNNGQNKRNGDHVYELPKQAQVRDLL